MPSYVRVLKVGEISIDVYQVKVYPIPALRLNENSMRLHVFSYILNYFKELKFAL